MALLLLIPLAVALLCWLSAWAMFRHLVRENDHRQSVKREAVEISVVIPARNEEENLRRLLPALANQDCPFREIIVVDDESNDRTSSVAKEGGAKVVPGKDLPEGWNGKPWALKQGSDVAAGDWLLFLDADTIPLPGFALELAQLAHPGVSAISFCPYHRIESCYENLSAFFHLSMVVGTNAFGWRGDRASQIEFVGQCLFVRAEDYDRAGGHESVKAMVLENFHLAHQFRTLGMQCRTYSGKNLIEMRMYPDGFKSMRNGWLKGFSSGAESTPTPALVSISVWYSGLSIVIVSLVLLPFLPPVAFAFSVILYLLYSVQCAVFFRRTGNYSLLAAFMFPVNYLFYLAVFTHGCNRRARGATSLWKGRDVA